MSVPAMVSSRLTANRRLFLAIYAGLGLLSTCVYLSQVNIPFGLIVGSRFGGLRVILVALPAILPYVISGIYAWQLISERKLGLYLCLVVTVIGTVVASLAIIGTFDVPITAGTVFWYVLGQVAVYGLAAEFLLRIEWP